MLTGNKPTSAMRVSEAWEWPQPGNTHTYKHTHTHTQTRSGIPRESLLLHRVAARQTQPANGARDEPSLKCNTIFTDVKKISFFFGFKLKIKTNYDGGPAEHCKQWTACRQVASVIIRCDAQPLNLLKQLVNISTGIFVRGRSRASWCCDREWHG